MSDESDTYELEGTLANARYWHKRAEKAESQNQALQEALRLGLLAMERHDAWCGHYRDAPGDPIHHQFTDAARNALSPTQETDPE